MMSGVFSKSKHQLKVSQLNALIDEKQWNDFKRIINSDPFMLFVAHEGLTVLQFLCQHGPILVLKTLIEHLSEQQLQKLSEISRPAGWNPNVLNELMFFASKNENSDLLKICLRLGANGNAPDKLQNRPLHYVMMVKNEDALKRMANILLEFDVDEHLKNGDGKTAIDVADRVPADWFIQRSRSIRLKELKNLQELVTILQKQVTEMNAELKEIKASLGSPRVSQQHTFPRSRL